MGKQSLFKSFLNLFYRKKQKPFGKNISIAEAINIQNAYMAQQCRQSEPNVPTYLTIGQQLFSPKKEVVMSALYYLYRIAENETSETNEILHLLEDSLNNPQLLQEHKPLIFETISKIKENNV